MPSTKKKGAGHRAVNHVAAEPMSFCDIQLVKLKPSVFPDKLQQATSRFMKFTGYVACAHCGKKKRTLWTSFKFFHAVDKGKKPDEEKVSDKIFPPLTPVCEEHELRHAQPYV